MLSSKIDSFNASLKTSFTSFEICEKSNKFFKKTLFSKSQITFFLETQTAILDKLAKEKHERNNQQHAISVRKSNKRLPSDFLQQQEVQQNQSLIK